MRYTHIVYLTFIFALAACSTKKSGDMKGKTFTHLALGDSYTIGEAVEEHERWPVLLAQRLKKDTILMQPTIVATTGWTTDELQKGIVGADLEKTYDFVSLLIGVNNQYRGYPIKQYEAEFKELLNQAIQFADGNPYHVIVVSIPDYGVTSFAQEKMLDSEKIMHELDSYNAIAEKISRLRDVKFINITPKSRMAKENPSLIASDGLHPSGEMYKMWVDQMYDHVFTNLSSR